MSHAMYQTTGFVLKTKNMRESNKLLWLYTERFGLIHVSLQGVRELSSKMSFHSHALSLVEVDVVRGRDIWRMTGIHENISSLSFVDLPWYGFFARLSTVLVRLCPGEEVNTTLWADIITLFDLMKEDQDVDLSILEIIVLVRVLYHLGYWDGHEVLLEGHDLYHVDMRSYAEQHRTVLIQLINQSLKDSQL